MPEACVEHHIHCSEQTFWSKVFFDREYNRQLCIDHMSFRDSRELEHEDRGDRLLRRIAASPPLAGLPRALAGLFAEGTRFEEHGVFERAARCYTAQVVPNRMAKRIRVQIVISTRPDGVDSCTRIARASMSAQLFGVGALLERFMVDDFTNSYALSAEFTNRFLAEHRLR